MRRVEDIANAQKILPSAGRPRRPVAVDSWQEQIKAVIAETKLEIGMAVSEGDCFFDAFAQALENKDLQIPGDKGQLPYKRLRMLCDQYIKEIDRAPAAGTTNWVKAAMDADGKIGGQDYQTCLAAIQYTQPEMESQKEKGFFSGQATWGRPVIEGRMLCEILTQRFGRKLSLHAMDIQSIKIDGVMSPITGHCLINSDGGKEVSVTDIHYEDNTLIHLFNYKAHYVPLLSSIPKLTPFDEHSPVPKSKESHAASSQENAGAASSAGASAADSIPLEWQWVKEFVSEVHLPHLGLPVRIEQTQANHMRIAFDPETKKAINVDTGKAKIHKNSPVGFIESTRLDEPFMGSHTPAAVRYTRLSEALDHGDMVKGIQGEKLFPCIAHGDFVQVEALQADHAYAKSEILSRQQRLIEKLNSEPAFATFVMGLEGMSKFFVKVDDRYYGTLFFYELYFNDIDNIWLICEACNLHKSNEDTLGWFQKQWLYGVEFLDYVGKLKDSGLLAKAQNKQGLGKIAIQWFWDRHANYASVAKTLLENVITPVRLLNQKVDIIIGLYRQNGNKRRMERHVANLEFRLALLTAAATMKGIEMPRAESESEHSSSDEERYLTDEMGVKRIIPLATFQQVAKRYIEEFPVSLKRRINEIIDEVAPSADIGSGTAVAATADSPKSPKRT